MDMSRILQIFIGAVLFLSSCSTKDNNETSVSPEMCLTDSLMQVVSIDTVHTRILIDELTDVLECETSPRETYNVFYDKKIVNALLAEIYLFKGGSGAGGAVYSSPRRASTGT